MRVLLLAVVAGMVFFYTAQRSTVDLIDMDTDAKLARVRIALLVVHREPARVWSRRCEAKDEDMMLVQRDGRPAEGRCITRRVLRVPPV
jgi:hypothetical protein